MKSLRLRLIFLLSIGLSIAWIITAWISHNESRKEIDRLFDAQLAESAQILLGTARLELHERKEQDDDDVKISQEYEQKLAFQIWDESHLIIRSSVAPFALMGSSKEGYSENIVNGQPWRILTRWNARHEYMIQVAEPLIDRANLANHITFKMLLPMMVALPFLTLLIWFGVNAGLRPLNLLKQEVKQKTAANLEPLKLIGVPEEVAPLAQALNDLFQRLEQAFESERRFTADAAHELRTPLSALKIQAQVALRSQGVKERKLALQNVLHGVDRATRLVEQLLNLARVDPVVVNNGYQVVDLRKLVATIMADLETFAHGKEIELILKADNLYQVNGDEIQLGLLFRNLIDNAIRYTPHGGQVTIAIFHHHGITIEVSDTGPGIAHEERELVIHRFYRITGSGEEGSGLGLSIVSRIAQLHNATFELSEKTSGNGLLARIYWPPL